MSCNRIQDTIFRAHFYSNTHSSFLYDVIISVGNGLFHCYHIELFIELKNY